MTKTRALLLLKIASLMVFALVFSKVAVWSVGLRSPASPCQVFRNIERNDSVYFQVACKGNYHLVPTEYSLLIRKDSTK
jgi:hypothetical protein